MTRSRLSLALAGCLGLAAIVSAQRTDPADLALKAAMQQELVDGNLAAAVDAYKQIVARYPTNAPVVAAALVRLGRAYETLGNREARAAYEQVVRQFSDQKEAAAEASVRLTALAGPRPTSGAPTVRLVLTGDDAEWNAHITPDGRFLSRPDWNTGDLAVRNMATGVVTRLMAKRGSYDTSDEEVESAMLSPDGKQIAFVWWTNESDGKSVGSRDELRVMANLPGAPPRVLLVNPEYTHIEPIGWSRTGDSILVTLFSAGGNQQIAWVALLDGRITPLTAPSRRLRGRASLSADGGYVAYSALATDPGPRLANRESVPAPPVDQHLYVIAVDGSSRETALVTGANMNESPVWTPDGRHILFVSNRAGAFGLWSVGVEKGIPAGQPTPVRVSAAGRLSPIGMTRSGTYYYVPERGSVAGGGGFDVFVADVDPSTGKIRGPGKRVSESVVDWNRSPSWSPEGKRIAFKRRRSPDGSVGGGLVVQDMETGAATVYANDGADLLAPIWFHNSNALLLRRTHATRDAELYHFDLNTGRRTFLETMAHSIPPRNWRAAALSPDDKILYVATHEPAHPGDGIGRVVAWDLTTGHQSVVWDSQSRLLGAFDVLALSPDGHTLAMILQREGWPSRRLVRIGTDGSGYRELTSTVQGNMLTWTRDSVALLVVSGTPRTAPLVRVSVDTGQQESTGLTISQPSAHVVDVSSDGSRIVYSDSTRDDELWAIDNVLSMPEIAR